MGSANQMEDFRAEKVLQYQQHTFDALVGVVSWFETVFHLSAN
jgi:hypothetical protein